MQATRSAADHAVAQLRTEIVRGGLAPGDALSEIDTAARLGVSRTPVREAFLRLETEGLLTRRQGRLHVVELSEREARLVDEIRLPLELVALRQAMERDHRSLAYHLERTVVELRYELDQGEIVAALDAARAFHDVIHGMTGNPILTRVLGHVFNHVHQYRYFRSARGVERLEQSERDHRSIIDAIRAGDHATAERLITVHLEDAHEFRTSGEAEPVAGLGLPAAPSSTPKEISNP
jgi:DNA-binding GntR family transcriptional regulator